MGNLNGGDFSNSGSKGTTTNSIIKEKVGHVHTDSRTTGITEHPPHDKSRGSFQGSGPSYDLKNSQPLSPKL
jgi:hypothetical protein